MHTIIPTYKLHKLLYSPQQKYSSSTHVWTQLTMGWSWDFPPCWGDPMIPPHPLLLPGMVSTTGLSEMKGASSDTFFAPIRICFFLIGKENNWSRVVLKKRMIRFDTQTKASAKRDLLICSSKKSMQLKEESLATYLYFYICIHLSFAWQRCEKLLLAIM